MAERIVKQIVKQQFRITPTGKASIARIKRWFYANFYGPVSKQNAEIAERNKSAWAELSRTLVEYMENHGLTDHPVRLTLTYAADENSSFEPLEVEVEKLEIKVLERSKIIFSDVSRIKEKSKIKEGSLREANEDESDIEL